MTDTVSGIRQSIACPDCDETFSDRDAFLAHREAEHPPSLIAVAGAGAIHSREAHGYQPASETEE